MSSNVDPHKKCLELLQDFEVGMLISHREDKSFHARPMHILDVNDEGVITLITSSDNRSVTEITEDPLVCVSFQDGKGTFLTLSGEATLFRDLQRIKELWSSSLEAWFPDGPASSQIVLIEIVPTQGEYWDGSGWNKAKYAFKVTSALLKEDSPKMDDDQHAKVAF